MRKRILLIIVPVILLIGFAGYYFFARVQEQFAESSAIQAVPIGTPMFISINKPKRFVSKLNDNTMCKIISSLPLFEPSNKALAQVGEMLNSSQELAEVFQNKQVLVSLHPQSKEEVTAMILVDKVSADESEYILKYLENKALEASLQVKVRKVNRVSIYDAKSTTAKKNGFAYALSHGVLMISRDALLIEDAIHQLDDEKFELDAELSVVLKTKDDKADMNLYINHLNIEKVIKGVASKKLLEKISLLKTYSNWTGLDLQIKEESIALGGFSVNNSDENLYANLLRSQVTGKSKIASVMPSSVAYYHGMYLSDTKKYLTDYETYLQRLNHADGRAQKLEKIQNNSSVKADELLVSIFSNEIAMAGFVAEKELAGGKAFFMKVKSGSSMLEQMDDMQQTYLRISRVPKDGWEKEYALDKNASFSVKRNPFPNLPEVWFGPMFEGMDANWYTVFENYLIFTDNYELACRIINANVLGETLGSEVEYTKFQSSLMSKSNVDFFIRAGISVPLSDQIFKPSIAKSMIDNADFRKFRMFGWQVVNSGDILYNNASITYSQEVKNKPQTVWQSKLESKVGIKPQFVVNHTDVQNKDIVVQDVDNNMYLIGNSGRINWKMKLDSRIKGEIHQIDVGKNGKLQMLFNTDTKIYLIDKEGNNVQPFPVNLRANASNPISVFDYDKNRNYRFFIACDDKTIYAYDPDGNLVDGWEPFHTDHQVTQAIQHFRIEGKDYIVASDEMKDYVLNRKGEVRTPTKDIYTHSKNNKIYLQDATAKHGARLATTDEQGNMHFTYFDGAKEVVALQEFSNKHFFQSGNIDQDEGYEYLFADDEKLTVFDHDHTVLLSKSFDSKISFMPRIYSFSGGIKKIGIVTADSGKIYLIDTGGNLHQGFPLEGISEFSIGFIASESTVFNLLVGSEDAYIYNYFVP